MDGIDNAPQRRHEPLVGEAVVLRRHAPSGMDGQRLHDDQSHPSGGPGLVVRTGAGARHTVLAEARRMRCEHDPVAKVMAAQRQRSQQVGESVACHLVAHEVFTCAGV
jgi:hypothetical protein